MSKLLHLAPTEGEEAALKFRRQLWEDRDFTDVTLEVVGGEEIHCHSVILAAASPVLRWNLLKSRQNQTCIDLDKEDSCSALVLKKLMEFMYIGECQLPESEIKKFLDIGDRLQVLGLCLPREGGREEEAQEEMEGRANIINTGVIKKRDNVVALLECERHHKNQSHIEEKLHKKVLKRKTAVPPEVATSGGGLQASKDNSDKNRNTHLSKQPKCTVTSPSPLKSGDSKTCKWMFENGQICGKVFTKTNNLTAHMRMHQDIRPFPCTICDQTFRQKVHLQRHKARHHKSHF